MKSKPRIVLISEYLGKEVNSTSFYWTSIFERIIEENVSVLIICPNSKENLNYLSGLNSKVNVKYFEHREFDKSNIFSRLLNHLRMSASFFWVAASEINKLDLVVSGTNPIFNIFSIGFLKNKRGFKWVLFAYDIFPNNLVPAGIIKESNIFFKISSKAFNYFYSLADEVITVGRDMKELLKQKLKPEINIESIPNWASHDCIEPQLKNESQIIIDNSLGSDVVFQFFGNLGRLQDVANILSAADLVKSSKAKILFIGDGSERSVIEKHIAKSDKNNVIYHGKCSMDQNEMALSSCDIALVTLLPGMNGLAVPSKSYFSMAADRPILVVNDDNSELRRLVDEYSIGWGCQAGKPVELANLIDGICRDPGCIANFEPRKVLISNFPQDKCIADILNVIYRNLP